MPTAIGTGLLAFLLTFSVSIYGQSHSPIDFAHLAGRGPVEDEECVQYGGRMLVHDEYNSALKEFAQGDDALDHGSLIENEGRYHVVYAVDNSGWLAWILGVKKYSLGICSFENEEDH